MDKLAEQIIEWIKNGNWEIVGLFILLISLSPICKRLVNADFSKLTKLSKLKELGNLSTDAVFLDYINEEIESLAFYKVTGIRTNKERRSLVLETFNKLNTGSNKFSMRNFQRSYVWLKFENGSLSAHMGLIYKIFFSVVFALGMSFFVFLLILDIIWIFNIDEFKEIVSNMIQINVMCLIYGILMLVSSFPLISVTILQKKLKE